jgi:hypothetical protein
VLCLGVVQIQIDRGQPRKAQLCKGEKIENKSKREREREREREKLKYHTHAFLKGKKRREKRETERIHFEADHNVELCAPAT